jgi:hypothetical protein
MATGIRRLSKIQWGKETTAGTVVAGTAVWRGKGNFLEDERVVKQLEENIGYLTDTTTSYIPFINAGLSLNQTEATFEQLQYLFVMACGGSTTGSADGAGSDKIFTTNLPTTALPTTTSYTIEAGDNHEVEQMEYSLVKKISINGGVKEALMVSADLIGRQITRISGFTGSLTLPTVEPVLFQKGKLYLDALGGTAGTTQVASTYIGCKLDFEFNWKPEFTGDGNLYSTVINFEGWSVKGEIMYLHDTAANGNTGAKTFFRNQTGKLMQLKWEGATVATPGTTYSKKTFILNLPIKFEKVSALDNKDGTNTVTLSFFGGYDATAATAGQAIIVTDGGSPLT